MLNIRELIRHKSLRTSGSPIVLKTLAPETRFPSVRAPEAARRFKSPAVDRTIDRIQSSIGNKELAWIFGNCFPNTLVLEQA
jgi:hypothetical protein